MAEIVRGLVEGFDAVILQNQWLRAVVIPSLGGRVWELEDRVRGRQWIWHRRDVRLAVAQPGAVYDDVWAGGWEELFPNDAPGSFEGRMLPDHGEWWTRSWDSEAADHGTGVRLRLATRCSVIRASCIKEFGLSADAPELSVSYSIRSEEREPFHFLFKQHLPVSISPGCRLVLPGGTTEAVDREFGTIVTHAGVFPWPFAPLGGGGTADLREVPAQTSGAREFLYVSELPDGWCGVDDENLAASLRLCFDRGAFPFVWLFLSYGGWRDTYTAVLEPCTNKPKDLGEAVRRSHTARLAPGQTFRSAVTARLGGIGES